MNKVLAFSIYNKNEEKKRNQLVLEGHCSLDNIIKTYNSFFRIRNYSLALVSINDKDNAKKFINNIIPLMNLKQSLSYYRCSKKDPIVTKEDQTKFIYDKLNYLNSLKEYGIEVKMFEKEGDAIKEASYYPNDYYIIKRGNKEVLLSSIGVESYEYDLIDNSEFTYCNLLFRIKLNNKYGLINKKGHEIICPEYDNILFTQHVDFILAELNNESGLIDLKNPNEFIKFTGFYKSDIEEFDISYAKYKNTYILSSKYFTGTLEHFEEMKEKRFLHTEIKTVYDAYTKLIEDLKKTL